MLSNETGVNIKHLGAKGDGIADDTSIIQYAIERYDNIYIPKGIYKISKTITIPQNKIIKGDGSFNTQLNYTGTGNAIEIKYNAFGKTLIEDISIYKGTAYDTTDRQSIGIDVVYNTEKNRNVTNLELNRVVVRYFYKNFRSETPNALLNACFNDCHFQNGFYNCYIVGGFANYFNRCQFVGAKNSGFYQKSGEGTLLQCLIESNIKGVTLVNSGGKYVFEECFFENTSKESGITLFEVVTDEQQNPINMINIKNSHFYGGYEQVFITQCKHLNVEGNTFRYTGNRCLAYPELDESRIAYNILGNLFEVEPKRFKNINYIDPLVNDTGWIDVDTSDSDLTCENVQIRKIGKIVRLRGTITGFTDANIGGKLLTIPEGFTPDNNIDLVCVMRDNTRYQRTAIVRAYQKSSSSMLQLRGYDAESSTSNIISLDNLSYFTE